MTHAQTKRYEALDGMRGLCAVLVAIFHFDLLVGTGTLVKHGWLSVDMFFVLSGFVIALKYEERLQSKNAFWSFMGVRAVRLLPVQILGTAAVVAPLLLVTLTGHPNFVGVNSIEGLARIFFYGVLLLPLYRDIPFPANPPLWSLQAEWIVNILYGRWLSSARTRLLILLWAILVLCLVPYVFLGSRTWDMARPPEIISGTARAAMGFLAGVALYRGQGWLTKLPCLSPSIVFGIWFLICLVPEKSHMPALESLVAILGAPLSVALLVRGERPVPRVFTFLGRLSYPLYASHFAVINLAAIWLVPASNRNLFFLIPMLAGALLLAWGIDRVAAMVPALIRRRRILAEA